MPQQWLHFTEYMQGGGLVAGVDVSANKIPRGGLGLWIILRHRWQISIQLQGTVCRADHPCWKVLAKTVLSKVTTGYLTCQTSFLIELLPSINRIYSASAGGPFFRPVHSSRACGTWTIRSWSKVSSSAFLIRRTVAVKSMEALWWRQPFMTGYKHLHR